MIFYSQAKKNPSFLLKTGFILDWNSRKEFGTPNWKWGIQLLFSQRCGWREELKCNIDVYASKHNLIF